MDVSKSSVCCHISEIKGQNRGTDRRFTAVDEFWTSIFVCPGHHPSIFLSSSLSEHLSIFLYILSSLPPVRPLRLSLPSSLLSFHSSLIPFHPRFFLSWLIFSHPPFFSFVLFKVSLLGHLSYIFSFSWFVSFLNLPHPVKDENKHIPSVDGHTIKSNSFETSCKLV